jgi:hypothetical protein
MLQKREQAPKFESNEEKNLFSLLDLGFLSVDQKWSVENQIVDILPYIQRHNR